MIKRIIKRKRIIYLVLLVMMGVVLLTLTIITTKLLKEYPPIATFYSPEFSVRQTDDGMYFVKNYNYVYYVDMASGLQAPLCRKTNCLHNDSMCDAFVEGTLPPGLMVYGDKLYITALTNDLVYDESDSSFSEMGYCRVYESDLDGGNRKIIYESGVGGIQSMLASGDKLYISSTGLKGKVKENGTVDSDAYLYVYDLRWGKIKELRILEGSQEKNKPYIRLISNTGDRVLFSESYMMSDGNYTCDLYEIIDGYSIEKTSAESINEYKYPLFVENNKEYYYIEISHDGTESLLLMDSSFQVRKKIVSVNYPESTLRLIDGGYIIIFNTDYKKCLYDYKQKKLYVAKTCFHENGKYVSDIICIDQGNDTIYIDKHDYTGMKENEIYYEDISNYGLEKLTSFLQDYYYDYDELTDNEKGAIDWVDVY